MKNIAIVLSGCGHQDGAEITEATSTIISISETGAKFTCFAPNISIGAKNHITSGNHDEKRNILVESARIARGDIKDITELKSSDFDALVLPGGFGAALHLSTWAKDGANAEINHILKKAIESFYNDKKPIGAICIAPTIIAKVLGKHKITVTIGNDVETAQEIQKTGAIHKNCLAVDYIVDKENKIISTPAYMCANTPFEVFTGIRKMIHQLLSMT